MEYHIALRENELDLNELTWKYILGELSDHNTYFICVVLKKGMKALPKLGD